MLMTALHNSTEPYLDPREPYLFRGLGFRDDFFISDLFRLPYYDFFRWGASENRGP